MSFIQPGNAIYLWYWQLGRLRQAQADLAGAIAAYQQAVNNLQGLHRARVRGYRMPPPQFVEFCR